MPSTIVVRRLETHRALQLRFSAALAEPLQSSQGLEIHPMRRKLLLVLATLTALLLSACSAPAPAPETASQPAAGPGRAEMTVFRSPT